MTKKVLKAQSEQYFDVKNNTNNNTKHLSATVYLKEPVVVKLVSSL